MALERKSVAVIFTLSMILLSFGPLATADGASQAPSSYAFLPSWSGAISGDLDPSGENSGGLGMEFTNHDFDDEGNMYYLETDDYGNWMDNQYSFSNAKGFHLLKIDPEGVVEYTDTISCNNYCSSPDYTYSKVIGVHAVSEDQVYVIMSVYNIALTFGSTYHSNSGSTLVTAFFDNGTWSWVDLEPVPAYSYSYLIHHGVDVDGNLYTVTRGSNSNSWQEYSVSSYSPNGTNWVRSLEIPYQAPTYHYLSPFFDTNETGLQIFMTAKDSIKYDSQTTSCPLGGEGGYCHMWVSVDMNGAKQKAVSAPYSSITFTMMKVENEQLYLTGHTDDYVAGSDTESNFTGQKISHSPRYAQYVAVMENDGSWDSHLTVNEVDNGYQPYAYISDVLEDGSVIFNAIYSGTTSINGTVVTEHSGVDAEAVISRIDPENGPIWSRSIGFSNPSSYPLNAMRSDGDTVAFVITHPSSGTAYYEYQGVEVNSPVGSNNTEILWIDLDDGKVVDVESTGAISVDGRSPDGGVIASTNNMMYYFMPDFDGDNVGSIDNCPDQYNPDQADYNSNGIGDACDDDDDSDGILDGIDDCPLGAMSWISSSLNDHDGDGCKDIHEEDLDDDNDGKQDIRDSCPIGIIGAGYDLDGDGCKDVEDDDDDGDLIRDESDLCAAGLIDWSSGTLTDHDGDGCKDDDPEDADDDNDGVADSIDACPRGAVDWPSNINTDFDGDGCKDSFEDEDDDNDGISNIIDNCPRSVGLVNAQGCTATQVLDDDNGGSSLVYYVCPVGSVVVLDPSDCPETETDNVTQGNTSSAGNDTAFYYVCPGGTDVVDDLSECSGTIGSGGTNVTLIVDPTSNGSSDYHTCDGGKAIVLNPEDCPNTGVNSVGGSSESSESKLMIMFMGGTFAMSVIAVIVVLIRRPHIQGPDYTRIDSTEHLFKEEPKIPASEPTKSSPPSTSVKSSGLSNPSMDLIGAAHEGKEWLEWPEGSTQHWYREVGFGGEWNRYQK